jgi:hypothetical protein
MYVLVHTLEETPNYNPCNAKEEYWLGVFFLIGSAFAFASPNDFKCGLHRRATSSLNQHRMFMSRWPP